MKKETAKMNLTALIVDDEPIARKYIREMLKGDREIDVVGEAGNGKKAAKMLAELQPDIVFLDIQMPEMDGFALLQTLDAETMPCIIFTTAYEEHAIRAFEFHALDYLLKPFDEARFAAATAHAKRSLARGRATVQAKQIAELLDSMSSKERPPERLLIKKQGRIIFLKIADIDWIKADDKYLQLFTGRVSHLVRQTLQSFKSKLDPSKFVQINRSVIVNVDRICELHPMFNGEHEVQIADGTTFPLSRSHRNELFELLGKPVA